MRRFTKIFGGFGLAAIIVGLAIGVYAFTAGNTVPSSNAGDGNNTVSGYSVGNITYGVNASVINQIDSVSFKLTPDNATHVTIAIGGHTYGGGACTETSGTWTCTTSSPQLDATSPLSLELTAAQ